jgi:3-deoxy-7-phosphoheptulonate synthase
VEPVGLAAIVAGADGLIIEVHPNPDHALSDGAQSLTPENFAKLVDKSSKIAAAMGRAMAVQAVADEPAKVLKAS